MYNMILVEKSFWEMTNCGVQASSNGFG
jgi:hypothetical protein